MNGNIYIDSNANFSLGPKHFRIEDYDVIPQVPA